MRLILALVLLTLAAPLASASHFICPGPELCFRNSGYSNGDCDTTSGEETTLNVIYLSSETAAGTRVRAGATTVCSDSSSSGSHYDASAISGNGEVSTPAGRVAGDFVWQTWTKSGTGGFQSFCATNVAFSAPVVGAQVHRLGCILGSPPEVPILLP